MWSETTKVELEITGEEWIWTSSRQSIYIGYSHFLYFIAAAKCTIMPGVQPQKNQDSWQLIHKILTMHMCCFYGICSWHLWISYSSTRKLTWADNQGLQKVHTLAIWKATRNWWKCSTSRLASVERELENFSRELVGSWVAVQFQPKSMYFVTLLHETAQINNSIWNSFVPCFASPVTSELEFDSEFGNLWQLTKSQHSSKPWFSL